MSGLKEAVSLVNTDFGSGRGQEETGRGPTFHQWFPVNENRGLGVSVFGGPEYHGIWKRSIQLCSLVPELSPSRFVMMETWVIVDPNEDPAEPQVVYSVNLDTISSGVSAKRSESLFAKAGYSSASKGVLGFASSWSNPCPKPGTSLDSREFDRAYLEQIQKNGVYRYEDLPERIDVQATVAAFREQIQRQDFSQPKLILPPDEIGNGQEFIRLSLPG